MLKVKIVLDEEKINADAVYYPEEIRRVIDEAFFEQGIVKEGEHFYVGTGSDKDLARFGNANWALAEKDWMARYIKEWLWIEDSDNAISTENLITFFKAEKIGAFA